MPQHHASHRDTPQAPRDKLSLPATGPAPAADLFAAMIGFAGRAQAAFAEAALANLQQTLETAQKAVETTRTSTREVLAGTPVDGENPALVPPAVVPNVVQTIADRNMKALEEMATVAQKCTRAYLALPSELVNCRTPQDVLGIQFRFWRTAADDCAEAGRRVMDAISGETDGDHNRHVPTVAEVLGQRTAVVAERAGQREGQAGARSETGTGRDQPRRSAAGEARLNA